MLHVYYPDQKITYNKYCFLFKWQGGESEGFIDLARGGLSTYSVLLNLL